TLSRLGTKRFCAACLGTPMTAPIWLPGAPQRVGLLAELRGNRNRIRQDVRRPAVGEQCLHLCDEVVQGYGLPPAVRPGAPPGRERARGGRRRPAGPCHHVLQLPVQRGTARSSVSCVQERRLMLPEPAVVHTSSMTQTFAWT